MQKIVFIIALSVVLTALINLLLSFIGFKYIFKPIVIVVLLVSAVAGYFMQHYGVMLDVTMIHNIIETDPSEVTELFNTGLFLHILVFGVLPVLIILRTNIVYKPIRHELLGKAGNWILLFSVITVTLFLFYKEFVSFGRNHKELSHLINPLGYFNALRRYHDQYWVRQGPVKPIDQDAYLLTPGSERDRKNLTILVVGETARASNFSLNGYAHNTNPRLAKQDILNFSNAWSCGTATAVSLPCMFSNLGREQYNHDAAMHQENLLDVLQHAGVKVLWRDNNSGCKGVCGRIDNQVIADFNDVKYCVDGECYDDVLLNKLQQYIDTLKQDAVIVLHMQGSHGPTYHLRYPPEFAVFTPFCASNQLEDCTREEIVNVYDNTILYTDHVLNAVIELLKQNDTQFNTAMLYVSDHGESLGDNGIYLHGLPYFIAPDEQKHVSLIVWLSDQYAINAGIDKTCLKKHGRERYSHDNLYHSILGLMGVGSTTYKPALDMFAPCNFSQENTLRISGSG